MSERRSSEPDCSAVPSTLQQNISPTSPHFSGPNPDLISCSVLPHSITDPDSSPMELNFDPNQIASTSHQNPDIVANEILSIPDVIESSIEYRHEKALPGGIVEIVEESIVKIDNRNPDLNLIDREMKPVEHQVPIKIEPATIEPIIEEPISTSPDKAKDIAADLIHHVKWIAWHSVKTPIVTQNENGPCPLLAIINVLLLRGQVQLPDGVEIITTQSLLQRLGDCILRLIPKHLAQKPDYQQNVNDSLYTLPKLSTGLDVNVRFTGVDEFEYTPECIVFDLLNIGLYHGWLIDQNEGSCEPVCNAIKNLSYNQLVEMIIDNKTNDDPTKISEALLAEDFLDNTASQLTQFGLDQLKLKLRDGELAVFFRNNHFSTILKHEDTLLLLVTDQGFLNEHEFVWETLEDVAGNSRFINAEFKMAPLKKMAESPMPPNKNDNTNKANTSTDQKQLDSDLLIAMSLAREDTSSSKASEESDLQMALKLQEEEDRLGASQVPQQSGGAAGGPSSAGSLQPRNNPDDEDDQSKKKRCDLM